MFLVDYKVIFSTPDYIDEETAAANLDIARLKVWEKSGGNGIGAGKIKC